MSLNETLKKLRTDRKLTQNDLAKIMNCNRQKIADWERGKSTPSAEDLILLSKKFNVSADYLLGLSDTPSTDKNIQFICNYTGLSANAILVLHENKSLKNTTINEDEIPKIEKGHIIIDGYEFESFDEYYDLLLKEETDFYFSILNDYIIDGTLDLIAHFSSEYYLTKKKIISLFHDCIDTFFETYFQAEDNGVIKIEIIEKCKNIIDDYRKKLEKSKDTSDLDLFRIQKKVLEYTNIVNEDKDKQFEQINICSQKLQSYISKLYHTYNYYCNMYELKEDFNEEENYKSTLSACLNNEDFKMSAENIIKIGEEYGYHKETQ